MRALVIVLDSVGAGYAPDAAKYNDEGANTLGHVFAHCQDLQLPTLSSLGLHTILGGWGGFSASCGRMREVSAGKDTTAGHWEIAGVILQEPFATFKEFPVELVSAIEAEAGVEFIGNYAQSGTVILKELGARHLKTGSPILYTSADSVMQIAAHERIIPRKQLYEICRIARRHCNPHRIGRVIARPFAGPRGKFTRTAGRHDYSMVPPRTVLNAIAETGLPVEGIGKISDIFGRSGVTSSHPTESNEHGMRTIEEVWRATQDGLVFANLSDFDVLYGHRRDVHGYAKALAHFDQWLAPFLARIEPEDLLIITADHGNDPAFSGTDHTREEVPLIVKYDTQTKHLGTRETFADVAATLAGFFHLKTAWPVGNPFFEFPR